MIIQLNPPIPIRTPKGVAIAHLIIDDGLEHDLKWVCFQDSTGECWTFRNRFIRADVNITQGREHISPYYNPQDVALKNENHSVCDEYGEYKDECICEEEEEKDIQYWKDCHSNLEEQITEFKENIIKIKLKLNNKENELIYIRQLVKQLLNEDKIYPDKRTELMNMLVNTNEFEYGYDGKIIDKK